MITIAINGYGGRMGQAIQSLQTDFSKQASIVDFKNLSGKKADVVIDFSRPESLSPVLKYCTENKAALVSGTTGFSEAQKNELQAASAQFPVLWDANMSLGVQWLLHALQAVKSLPADFNIQLEEVHHKHKVDAPSGTAIEIQKVLQSCRTEKLPEPISIRGGGVFGEHKVIMMGEEEVITFDHNVLSRKVFARGAVTAALWLSKQKPGFYRMRHIFEESNG